MSKIPSIYNETKSNALTADNAQIQYCMERCKKCDANTTILFLSKDIPVFMKCFACNEPYLFIEKDLLERHLI